MALLGKKEERTSNGPLFKREDDNVSSRPGEVHTLLGKGSEFDGKLTFEGQVRIDGKFTGQIITKDTLVIGDGARVNAEIQAGTVIINGTVEGNIRATQHIELHTPARIKGSLETPTLSMDRGVIFEGTLKMENLGKTNVVPVPGAAAGEAKK